MSSAGVALAQFREDDVLSPTRFIDRPELCSDESIMINLIVAGSLMPMRVMEYDSIASVKLRIQACKGFVVKKQKLVFGGRELARNNSLVRDYGVSNGNVLHLVLKLSELRAITVKTVCGMEFEFHVEKGKNVGYVKQQIAKKGKQFLDLDEQELICNGEKLDDQKLIDEICKENDDAVILLSISRSAKVRSKPVGKDFELSVDAPDDAIERERKRLEELLIAARRSPDREFGLEPVRVNRKIVLPSVIKDLITSTFAGLDNGNSPVRAIEGSGGVYFMRDFSGREYVSVFKPVDEEPMAVNNPQGLPLSENGEGLKKGTKVGEGALREVAAYILDYPLGGPRLALSNEGGFSGVPPTVMIKCLNESFYHPNGFEYSNEFVKAGSLQMFVKNDGSCEDMGPRDFPLEEVHKISVLDIRLANADRHAGNILISREGPDGLIVLVPIDHGYCLPENFEDCTFEWLYWPQARKPFSSRTLNYIKSLDAEKDIAILRFHGWILSLECSRTLRISTMLLKKGAERGLTPFAIGSIMCRETLKRESVIELIISEAEDSLLPGMSEAAFLESISQIMDRRLDELAP